jgi:hypothetical protein
MDLETTILVLEGISRKNLRKTSSIRVGIGLKGFSHVRKFKKGNRIEDRRIFPNPSRTIVSEAKYPFLASLCRTGIVFR